MLDDFPFYLSLVIIIVLLVMVAKKIRVAYPVLLVLAGLMLSFIPKMPRLSIDPELIFVIFLPPLLYEAAWSISWKELWRWRRIIGSFAFIVVFFTALSVALVTNYFIPGFSLALGFLLGGIISPPDAVSAGTILKFVNVPRRMSSMLQGESLLNDASSLIIFRFALISVATGQFIWSQAALSFSWMLLGGIGIGLLVAWLFMKMHKYLPTDTNIDIVLSLVTPYLIYIVAEEAHSSGVLAVVSGGLLLSNNRHHFLSSASRIRELNVWESLSFLLNGLVFMLIGLALPEIRIGLEHEGISMVTAIEYGAFVTLVLVVIRMISTFSAVVITLIARNFITVADARNPGIKAPMLLGWSGMRGVVSLAAALSIPVKLANGSPFPQRNLILFITFVVILLTLVVQGLTLPYVITKINMADPDLKLPEDEVDRLLQKQLSDHMLDFVNDNYSQQLKAYPMLQQLAKKWEMGSPSLDEDGIAGQWPVIYRDLLKHQREWLLQKNNEDELLDEEIIRRYLLRLDLEEEKLGLM
jgi:CPA1 family monovalent cation:H+ antiporter